MPLPLFLPCAAGVEALLAEETARLLPDAAVRAARGGVSLAGDPHEVMVLNLESRLAQRVLIEVGEGPYRDESDLYSLALGVAWSDWITPRQTLRVDTTSQRSPLKEPQLRRAARQGRRLRPDARRARRAAERRHRPARPSRRPSRRRRARRDLRRQLGRVALQARLARGPGRRTAQGDARRGDARRRRLARHSRRRRRAQRPVLRLGDDRDRGGADRHGPGARPPAPLRLRAAAAVRRRRASRRLAAPQVEGGGPSSRAAGADLRERHLLSHGRLRAPQRRACRRRRGDRLPRRRCRSSARRRRSPRRCPAR